MLTKSEEDGREVWRIRVIYMNRDDALANSGHGEPMVECDMLGLRIRGFDRTAGGVFVKLPDPVVDEEVEKLLRWRDSLALDSWGEELVSRVYQDLNQRLPEQVPEHLRRALVKWQAMDENERYRIAQTVLD